jgi:beta-phosphoglucomutase
MTTIKACLFDLDGVLVDTAGFHYLAWKRMANVLGCDFNEHDNEQLKGVSRDRSLEIILEIGRVHLDEADKKKYAEMKNQWYLESVLQMSPKDVLPGVIDFLTDLRKAGIKTALGSASKNAMLILERIGMVSYFDAIIDGLKASQAKPHPEVFLMGAEALDVAPSECVVFEDAQAGIEAAINAGMHCIGVGSPDSLKKADFVIASFKDMSIEKFQLLKGI